MERISNFEERIKYMKNTYLSSDVNERDRLLGHMIERSIMLEHQNLGGKVKISTATVIKAFEDIYLDSSSRYYTGDNDTTLFNYYNAFTEIVRDDKKDIMNKFEKTILINDLFGL